jgi:UDP-N-acetylglucosamine acyltransferase
MPDISPQAVVEPTAQLADDVRIGPFTYIGPHVQIGPACVIANNVTITGRTTLGPNTRVFPMAVIAAPADPAQPPGECTIGPKNAIREHVTIYTSPDEPTHIGKDNLIMVATQVGPGASIADHGVFANCTRIGPRANIEPYVRTSAFTVIDAGVTVGAYTFTAGYVHVTHDAPPFAMLQGAPFRVRGVNTQNLHRCGFGDDDIRQLKAAFHELYRTSDTNPDQTALRRMLDQPQENHCVRRLLQALQRSLAAQEPREDEDG